MIAVEWNDTLKAVSLIFDEAGANALAQRILALASANPDHTHLHIGAELSDSGRYEAPFGELVLLFEPDLETLASARELISSVA